MLDSFSTTTKIFIFIAWLSSILLVQLNEVEKLKQQPDLLILEEIQRFRNKYPGESEGSNPFDVVTTEKRLAKILPYDKNEMSSIPKNIYQIWLGDKESTFQSTEYYRRWHEYNLGYNHTFIHDSHIEMMFKDKYSQVPEVIEAYHLLPTVILKADFARYLLVLAYGGTYSDTDVWVKQPVDSWFDGQRNIGFVAGIEDDRNNDDRWGWKSRAMRLQLQQWLVRSKAHHPIMRRLVSTIISTTFQAKVDNKKAWWHTFGFDSCDGINIMTWTGPQVYSDIIYSYWNSLVNPTIVDVNPIRMKREIYGPEKKPGIGIDWKIITELDAPMVIDDTVVYPFRTLREAPESCKDYCYVQHHYEGTWKGE